MAIAGRYFATCAMRRSCLVSNLDLLAYGGKLNALLVMREVTYGDI